MRKNEGRIIFQDRYHHLKDIQIAVLNCFIAIDTLSAATMDRFSPPRRCDIRWHTEGGKSLLWGASSHYQVHICRSIHRRLLPYAPNNGSPMRYCRVSPYLSVRVTPFTITSDAALTNPLFLNICSAFIRTGRINPQHRENGWNDKLALTLEYGGHDTQDVVKPHHSARGMHPIDVYISST